ncbi:MAG: hypothetical protein J7M25_09670 [Deltaproteobacteria bacterium]|nr:hypothetical protein [Deltaproteobacteria bacterium]
MKPTWMRIGVWSAIAAWAALLSAEPGCAKKRECYNDVDCPYGAYCNDDSRCQTDCVYTVDCHEIGAICVRERGFCTTGDVDGGPNPIQDGSLHHSDADVNGDGAQGDAARTDATVSRDAGPTSGIYTDPCSGPNDCLSGQCMDDLRSSRDFCSRTCTSDRDCILTHQCLQDATLLLCQSSDVGKHCSGQSDCHQACLENSVTHESQCSTVCASAADCPAGYACTRVNGQKYCVNISRACTQDTDCITGVCLAPYTSPPANACSAMCDTSADCPVDSFCETVAGSTVCTPATYGVGGLGDSCTNNCQSGLCLDGMCTVKCGVTRTVGQYCPPGYGCNVSSGQAGNVLVCTPAGQITFGQTCTSSVQCVSTACMLMSNQSSECTRFCNDGSDCPSGYQCTTLSTVASGVTLAVCYH